MSTTQRRRRSTQRDSLLNRQVGSLRVEDQLLEEDVLIDDLCRNAAKQFGYGDSQNTLETTDLSASCSSFGVDYLQYSVTSEDKNDEDLSLQFSQLELELQREALAAIEQQHKLKTSSTNLQEDKDEGGHEASCQTTMIEIEPRVLAPLVGSQPTWEALMRGQIVMSPCSCCQETLTCINNVELVICDDCKVLSPVEHQEMSAPDIRFAVGLGIKEKDMEDYFQSNETN